jgi:O-methyltransferase involved in polyketide biosynthesis
VEAPGPDFLDQDARDRQRQTMQRVRDLMAELEPDRDIPDVQDLWYFEEREDVGEWLGRHGWAVTVTPAPELMAGYGRRPPGDIDDATPQTLFVSAQRTGKGE